MKLSWNSIKVSLAGARLSHLVQQNKIWDHGSMVEHVRTIFFKVKRTKNIGNINDLKKYLTPDCYEKLARQLDNLEIDGKRWFVRKPLINEVNVISVRTAKKNKPDRF